MLIRCTFSHRLSFCYFWHNSIEKYFQGVYDLHCLFHNSRSRPLRMLTLDLIHSILSLIAYYAFLRVAVGSTQLYKKFCSVKVWNKLKRKTYICSKLQIRHLSICYDHYLKYVVIAENIKYNKGNKIISKS